MSELTRANQNTGRYVLLQNTPARLRYVRTRVHTRAVGCSFPLFALATSPTRILGRGHLPNNLQPNEQGTSGSDQRRIIRSQLEN